MISNPARFIWVSLLLQNFCLFQIGKLRCYNKTFTKFSELFGMISDLKHVVCRVNEIRFGRRNLRETQRNSHSQPYYRVP